MNSKLTRAEATTVVLLTIGAVWLRLLAAVSGGPLWRDETNTVSLATLPTLGELWNNLQYDSFPLLWFVVVRGYANVVGPANDRAFRMLGLAIGLGLIATLWFYARTLGIRFPLVSLALLAMSPSVVIWGDSMRAYGFGMVAVLLAGAFLWRFVEHPTSIRFVAAAIAAIASVHTSFYNSVLLLAFCAGAVAVLVDNRAWSRIVAVVVIGAAAAMSMLPYTPMIREASSWRLLFHLSDYGFLRFWNKLYETLRPAGPWSLVVWTELTVLSLVAGARAIRYTKELGYSAAQRDVCIFSVVTLMTALPALFFFLKILSYLTQPWYYLALVAVCAVSVDAISGSLIHSDLARKGRLFGVIVLAGATLIIGRRTVSMRLTNIDQIASSLELDAHRGDLIIVSPWYFGVTFSRYYHGSAEWKTLPPIPLHGYHRFDLIREKMRMSDQRLPVASLNDDINATLRGGQRVFIVGDLPFPGPGEVPQVLPPAPLPGNHWPEGRYDLQWILMVSYSLQQHANSIAVRIPSATVGVNSLENASVLLASGWHE